mmetsp:Transcript_52522/g.122160  ORF Transcript_52522/g.122160 Transcript_52522/m.122160 type:complete len:235 (+) Transcript_52522:780-1484(+)
MRDTTVNWFPCRSVVVAAHHDAADHGLARVAPTATGRTTWWLIQPLHCLCGISPIRYPHRHTSCHSIRDTAQIASAARVVEDKFMRSLLQTCRQPCENGLRTVSAAMESGVHTEGVPGVNGVFSSRTVGVPIHVLSGLGTTLPVTVAVVPRNGRFVAPVRRGLKDVVVGFHNIDLGAPLPTHPVCVTVVRTAVATAKAGVATPIPRRALDEIKRQVARATHLTEVHCEGQRFAE